MFSKLQGLSWSIPSLIWFSMVHVYAQLKKHDLKAIWNMIPTIILKILKMHTTKTKIKWEYVVTLVFLLIPSQSTVNNTRPTGSLSCQYFDTGVIFLFISFFSSHTLWLGLWYKLLGFTISLSTGVTLVLDLIYSHPNLTSRVYQEF